jgi:hypothetical protein
MTDPFRFQEETINAALDGCDADYCLQWFKHDSLNHYVGRNVRDLNTFLAEQSKELQDNDLSATGWGLGVQSIMRSKVGSVLSRKDVTHRSFLQSASCLSSLPVALKGCSRLSRGGVG